MTCLLYWLTGFKGEDFKTFFTHKTYVKTMSAEGGHRTQFDHLRTIHAMFALNWLTGFRGEDF